VAAANFAVAATLAATTSLLALVVEDLLPADGTPQWPIARGAWLIATALLLFAVIWLRGLVHRQTGTLFYVRLLDASWSDWHHIPLHIASRRRMSLRSVTRWVDLPHRTHDNGGIELADVCAEVAAALEAAVNGDRDDTAYTIAPNMPWPAALAIGAELPIVDGLRLLELSGRPESAAQNTTEITFQLRPPETTTAARLRPMAHRRNGTRVGLLLLITSRGLHPDTVFDGMDVGAYYTLDPAALGLPGQSRPTLNGRELAALSALLPSAVAEVKQAAADRELVVAAAMPKTVAMALGWGLAQGPIRFFTGTHLLYVDVQSGRRDPMRVHPAQPAPALTQP
jgi:hypothetical protein